MKLSPLYWALITYILTHALGTVNGTKAVVLLHGIIDGLSSEPIPSS